MPKIQKGRAKLHSSAVGSNSAGWQRPGAPVQREVLSKRDEIPVLDEDVQGLDLTSALHETEEQKRAAVADALKDLIAMGSDSEEEEDEDEDDEEDAAALAALEGEGDEEEEEEEDDEDMDGRMPTKGQLQMQPKAAAQALANKSAAAVPTAEKMKAAGLLFAPSLPQRSAALADTSADAAAPAAGKVKASKLDKRAARHDKLMGRLALPGTLVAAVVAGRKGRHAPGGSAALQTLKQIGEQLASPLLTPQQQHALTMLQMKQARAAAAAQQAGVGDAASDARDVLFLSDEADKERLRTLQQQIRQRVAASQPKSKAAAAAAAAQNPRAAAAASSSPAAAAPAAVAAAAAAAQPVPSPFTAPRTKQSASARAKQHRAELAHFTAVLAHPTFQAAPLSTLQTHLHNTSALNKLQEQVAAMQDPTAAYAAPNRKNVSGSTKKKNKKAQLARQQVLQQMQR